MENLTVLGDQPIRRKVAFSPRLLEAGIFTFLLLSAIAINLRMLRDGPNGLGDARWHLTWIRHFSAQIMEGVWYPRWLAGTNFGYGSPTFVFYPPLVYYGGALLRVLGLSVEQTFSMLITGSIFLSGLSFYYFGKYIWGQVGAVFGALAYMLSPGIYDLLHGGGVAALYAYVWLPLLLLFTHLSADRAISVPRQGRYRLLLALVWTLTALTHLPSLLIYAVAWTFYTVVLLWRRPWRIKLQTWIAAPLGWGMAAFFLIPAILEQRYINIDYMLASQDGFQSSMPQVSELLKTASGRHFLWQLLICAMLTAIAQIGFSDLLKKSAVPQALRPLNAQARRMALILLAVAGLTVFLISSWSWPLWWLSPILQKIELSSRLDRLLYIIQAALCAIALQALWQGTRQKIVWKQGFLRTFLIMIVCALLFGNFKYSYQLARKVPGLYSAGNGVVVNREWIERIVQDSSDDSLIDVPEYRPALIEDSLIEDSSTETIEDRATSRSNAATQERYVKEAVSEAGYPISRDAVVGRLPTPQPNQPEVEIAQGQATVDIINWQSYQRRMTIAATTPTTALIRTYVYPAWQLSIDGERTEIVQSRDGRIQFSVPAGNHDVVLKYGRTLAFNLGTVASILSAIAFIGLGYYWIVDSSFF